MKVLLHSEESPLPECHAQQATGKRRNNRCQSKEREYDHRQRGENGRRRNLQASDYTGEEDVLRKKRFPALPEIIAEEKPDIVVIGWPYFLQVFFQPALRKAMKSCNAKLVIREIPSRLLPTERSRNISKPIRCTTKVCACSARGPDSICANG